MQAVLRFIPDHRLRPVDDGWRDLLTAMRRQAMHEHRVLLGTRHQPLVDSVRHQLVVPLLRFPHPHGYPGVGDHQISIINGLLRRGGEHDVTTFLPDPLEQAAVRTKRLGTREAKAKPETDGGMHP
jgi:hypothetical protein